MHFSLETLADEEITSATINCVYTNLCALVLSAPFSVYFTKYSGTNVGNPSR